MARAKKVASDPHVARALAYCADVLSGAIPAPALVKAACARHLGDLERSKTDKAWPFVFDPAIASRPCRFIELLPHLKGPLAGQPIELEPWQCFLICCAFGWVHRKTKLRRFRRVIIFVPRKNGKSSVSSGVALYCLAADNENGAEVYSAATTRDQARIVFGDAQNMMRKAPALRAKLGVEVQQHSIFQAGSGSKFVPLSREADNLDGLNIACAIVDEVHAHKTREIWDVLETGIGARAQPLLWAISTAGSDTSGIGFELYTDAKKILTGAAKDDSIFACIWEMDPGDDWTQEATWVKANPNWGVSVRPEVIRDTAAKAMRLPSAQSAFLTKHLDVWVNADQAWMDMRVWDRCADPTLNVDDCADAQCVLGLDLAWKSDIAAKTRLFWRDVPKDNPKGWPPGRNYFLFLDSYLPEDAVTDGRNSQYQGWEIEGRLTTTPGSVTDFGVIRDDIIADAMRFKVREVAYDPAQATQIQGELSAAGLTMVEMRPLVLNFSEPMKQLDAIARTGHLHHDGNPVLRWMISNVVAHADAKDNIYPRKQRPENKIDGAVAAIMALGRAMVTDTPTGSYLETSPLVTLD